MARVFVRTGFSRHRKVRELRKLLECDRHTAMGIAVSLWLAAMEQEAFDGKLRGWTAEHIAEEIQYGRATPDVLVAALVQSGFLDVEDGDYVIHDWVREQGQLINRLASDRKRREDNSDVKSLTGPEEPTEPKIPEDHSEAERIVKEWNRHKTVQHVTKQAGVRCVEFYRSRGVELEAMEQAVCDPEVVNAKKFFEVLDALDKARRASPGGGGSLGRVKEGFLKEGGRA